MPDSAPGEWGSDFSRGVSLQYRSAIEGPAPSGERIGNAIGSALLFGKGMIGATAASTAKREWSNGNYGASAVQGMSAIGQAGLTLLSAGTLTAARQSGVNALSESLVASDLRAIDSLAPNSVDAIDTAANSKMTFSNRFPEDTLSNNPVPAIPNNTALSQSQKILYVVNEDGSLVIAPNKLGADYGHLDLAQGKDVLAAGEGKILNGNVNFLDNASGHYLPTGQSAQQAAVDAFSNAGFNVTPSSYVEKVYDFSLGKWVPKK